MKNLRDYWEKRKLGGHKRQRETAHLRGILEKTLDVIFLFPKMNGRYRIAVVHDVLKRREYSSPEAPSGYYLEKRNLHLPIRQIKYCGVSPNTGRPRISVGVVGSIEEQIEKRGGLEI